MKMNKKGFTLIELLAVIVILAIIALIATPIIMNVITKSQDGADARSVEAYGKAIESAYYQYLIDNPTADADTLNDIKGNVVEAAADELAEYMTLSGNGEDVECASGAITKVDGVEIVTLQTCSVANRDAEFGFNSAEGATKTN